MEFTKKEKEILKYLCVGYTYEQIAKILLISVAGVRFHIHNILQKLELRDKTQLVSFVLKQGNIME